MRRSSRHFPLLQRPAVHLPPTPTTPLLLSRRSSFHNKTIISSVDDHQQCSRHFHQFHQFHQCLCRDHYRYRHHRCLSLKHGYRSYTTSSTTTTSTATHHSRSSSMSSSVKSMDSYFQHFFDKFCSDLSPTIIGNDKLHALYSQFLQSCYRIRFPHHYNHYDNSNDQQQNPQQQQQQNRYHLDWTHDFHMLTRGIKREMDHQIRCTLNTYHSVLLAKQQQQQQQQLQQESFQSSQKSHTKQQQQQSQQKSQHTKQHAKYNNNHKNQQQQIQQQIQQQTQQTQQEPLSQLISIFQTAPPPPSSHQNRHHQNLKKHATNSNNSTTTNSQNHTNTKSTTTTTTTTRTRVSQLLTRDDLIREIHDRFSIVLQRFQTYSTTDLIFTQFCRIMFSHIVTWHDQHQQSSLLSHTASSCDRLLHSIQLKQQQQQQQSSTTHIDDDSDSGSSVDEYGTMKKVCNFFIMKHAVMQLLRQRSELRSTMQQNMTMTMMDHTQQQNQHNQHNQQHNIREQQHVLREQWQEQLRSIERQLYHMVTHRLNQCITTDDDGAHFREYYSLRITVNLHLKQYEQVLLDCQSIESLLPPPPPPPLSSSESSSSTESSSTESTEFGVSNNERNDLLIYRALSYKGLASSLVQQQRTIKSDQSDEKAEEEKDDEEKTRLLLLNEYLCRSVESFDACSQLAPHHLPYYFHSAASLFVLGRYDDAIQRIERAMFYMRRLGVTPDNTKHDLFDLVVRYCRDMLPVDDWRRVQNKLSETFGSVKLSALDHPLLRALIDRIQIECRSYTV